jgi:sugar phosphate isomerase/epimerase
MLQRSIIQGRGFKNTHSNGHISGFQFQVRNPNYRGVAASLIDGIEISIGSVNYPFDDALWTIEGKTYTLDELRQTTDARWSLDELATITIAKPGGLPSGVHELSVCIFIRRSYIPAQFSRSPFREKAKVVLVSDAPFNGPKLAVSTYSYSNDMYSIMTLEDVMADIADIGASGIEILGEGNVQNYPNPSNAWKDEWFRLIEKYKLTPTNFGGWVDTAMWLNRDLTASEGIAQLKQDITLAAELGFSSIRPKFGVTSLELDPHPIWQESVIGSLDLAEKLGVVICPEIHSPTPIKHKVTQEYIRFIENTKSDKFKLLIDTGIFQTAPVDDGHEGIEMKKGVRPPFLEPLKVPMADLKEIMQHVYFIQAKFFEIDDGLHDLHIPWAPILETLKEANWQGWLSSEYEGRREPYRGKDQVRRQHALVRNLLR